MVKWHIAEDLSCLRKRGGMDRICQGDTKKRGIK